MRAPRWPVWLILLLAVAAQLMPLPGYLELFRPPWATMVVIYWVLMWPGRFGIISAWIVGLILDVAQGTLLGQHALTECLVAYVVMRFHLQMRVFPLWQLTLTVLALLFAGAFVNLWIDGIAGRAALGPARWGPVIAGALLWPVLMTVMDRLRERLERRDTSFA
jgi:rod shape-determining protein MreD